MRVEDDIVLLLFSMLEKLLNIFFKFLLIVIQKIIDDVQTDPGRETDNRAERRST